MQQKTDQPTALHPHSKKSLIILGLLLLICLVSGGVFLWQTYESRQSATTPPDTPVAPAPPSAEGPPRLTDPNQGYMVIKEWGVRLKPSVGLERLQYILMSQNTQERIGLSSEQLQKIDSACAALHAPLGTLERSRVAITDAAGTTRPPTKIVDGYYYYFTGPQASCLSDTTDTADNIAILEAQNGLVVESVATLEAVQ